MDLLNPAGPAKVRTIFHTTEPYTCVMNLVFYDRNCRLIDIWSFTLSENLLLSRTIWNLNYVDKVLSLQVSRGRENADLARTPNGKETTYPIITWYCMMNLVFYDRNCRLIDIWSFTCSEENKLKIGNQFLFPVFNFSFLVTDRRLKLLLLLISNGMFQFQILLDMWLNDVVICDWVLFTGHMPASVLVN